MDKTETLKYIGNLTQLGACRHYILTEGWARGLRATDFNTGSGLNYTVLPDRNMDISMASYKGCNLVYITCNGETHPSFFEPEGPGWLHTFSGGLIATCGLMWLGAPCTDGNEVLGLHGRISTTPAKQYSDLSGWENNDYMLKVKGHMEEGRLFGGKLRIEREISSMLGQSSIHLKDTVTNFGNQTVPFTLLYHMNFGYPLLSEHTELVFDTIESLPRDPEAEKGMKEIKSFSKPQPSFNEQVFYHLPKGNEKGDTSVTVMNREAGIAVSINFNVNQLSKLTQWKMMASGEYVLGIEPGNVHSKPRDLLRKENVLPFLQPGETAVSELEITVYDI